MIELKYSLIIEATEDPILCLLFSRPRRLYRRRASVEDCLYKAKWGMEEHVALLKERGLPVPMANANPTVVIRNERQLEAITKT